MSGCHLIVYHLLISIQQQSIGSSGACLPATVQWVHSHQPFFLVSQNAFHLVFQQMGFAVGMSQLHGTHLPLRAGVLQVSRGTFVVPSHRVQSRVPSARNFKSWDPPFTKLCKRYPEYGGPKPTSSGLSFDSAESFRQASKAMLELVGFVKWWTTWFPEAIVSNHCALPRRTLEMLT